MQMSTCVHACMHVFVYECVGGGRGCMHMSTCHMWGGGGVCVRACVRARVYETGTSH